MSLTLQRLPRRLLLLALVLAVLGVLQAPRHALFAATGDETLPPPPPPPSGSSGWQALPDVFSDTESPRFLTVSAKGNFTIPGTSDGTASNVLRITYAEPVVGGNVEIRVFDADYGGQWDQRVDQDFVFTQPQTLFEVFADPDDLIPDATVLAGVPLAVLDSNVVATDRKWTELLNLPVASPFVQGAKGTDGRYHFLVRTRLIVEDPFSLGFEINAYKIAFNGTYVLPAGQVLGFTGGAIDAIFIGGRQVSRDLGGFPVVQNNYYRDVVFGGVTLTAGSFEFPFDNRAFCERLRASNGDADWNATIPQGTVAQGPTLTGIPPDNGGLYLNPQLGQIVDATDFRVGEAIQFQFLRPNGSVEFDSLTAPKTAFTPNIPAGDPTSHPSITESQQKMLSASGEDPFQSVVIERAALDANPGVWRMRWTGVDAHNSVFIKFDQKFGTTPDPFELRGRLFCDANGNGVFDAGEQPLALVPLVLKPVSGAAAIPGATLADGTFRFGPFLQQSDADRLFDLDLAPGAAICPTTQRLPMRVGPKFCDPVAVPFTCTYAASGHVFCDNNRDKVFNAGDTALTCNPTVRLELQGTPDFFEVVSVAGSWSKTGLKPGTWKAFVKTGSCADTLTRTSDAEQTFTISNTVCSVSNIDFGYVCQDLSICFKAFCDYDRDCLFSGRDELLPVTVTIAKQPTGLPTFTKTTTTNGSFVCFDKLDPGTYTVTVSTVPNATLRFTPPPVVLVDESKNILLCYDCLAAVHGKVLKETCLQVCDGRENGNETPLVGIKVELLGGPSAPQTFTTVAGGTYSFTNLIPGSYTVRVNTADPQNFPLLVGLVPNSDLEVPTVLQRGDDPAINFFFCECPRGRIHGYVFKNPPCESCDKDYVLGSDEPVPGVKVTLTAQIQGLPFLREDTTDALGLYEFNDLEAGTYTVSVDDPSNETLVLVLTPAGDVTVPGVTLPPGGDQRRDFGFCRQRACALVFREPPCECDGIFEPAAGDVPVEGATVVLTLTSGRGQGRIFTRETGNDGRVCFEDLPLGSYEITVPDQPALAGLTRSTDATLTWSGRFCADEFRFGWCRPGEEQTKLCAQVFCEPKGFCDGVFDDGRDTWMPWIEVFVALEGDNSGYLKSGFTDAQGRVCFLGLPAGKYVIYVGSNQDKLKAYKPSTPNCYRVTLEECDRANAPFGYCQSCVPTPCCEGDLHEVLVGTAIWVGRKACALDLKAQLLDGCACGCGSREIDRVGLRWGRHLPADLVGANDALTLVDIKVKDGVAYVVLKITAQGSWFRNGVFGKRDLQVRVTLNGTTYTGCGKFRCESFRPGLLFTWGRGCPSLPKCEGGWRWDGSSCWNAPWLTCGSKCAARFLVLDTKSKDTQDCGACERCTSCTSCPRCTELLPVGRTP